MSNKGYPHLQQFNIHPYKKNKNKHNAWWQRPEKSNK